MAIRTRKAQGDDAPRLAELWHEMAVFHVKFDRHFRTERGSKRWFQERIAQVTTRPTAGVFVAHDRGTIVGFIAVEIASRPECFTTKDHGLITDLVVTKAYRRQGIGRMLLRRALRWIRDQGLRRAEVKFATANPLSTTFWKAVGFQPYMALAKREI